MRSARNVRPTATAHWPTRTSAAAANSGTGKSWASLQLQQHEHAAVIGGDQLGRRLFAGGKRDQDRRRLLREIECAREDLAVGRNHEAGRGAIGQQRAFDLFQAADRADLHDRVGDACRRGTNGGFLLVAQRIRTADPAARQRPTGKAKC